MTQIKNLENKIPDTSGFVKKTDYNAKITEIEGKIPSISSLATKTALLAGENKIPNVSSSVKKTDYDTKISEPEKKLTAPYQDEYLTTPKLQIYYSSSWQKQILIMGYQVLIVKLHQIKQKMSLLKMNWKN